MAETKTIITSVAEAVCKNCIYSYVPDDIDELICTHTNGRKCDDFCNHGVWLYLSDRGNCIGTLDDIYWEYETTECSLPTGREEFNGT